MRRAIAALVDKAQGGRGRARRRARCGLADAVARYLFKLMAYKDEYEVARLYTDGAFAKQVANEFDGEQLRLEFHLAPPLLARRDKATGEPRKMTFGPWILPVFGCWRSSSSCAAPPSIRSAIRAERRTERTLIARLRGDAGGVLGKLTPENHHLAVGLAAIPEKIRGFGHVKMRHLTAAKADEAALLDQFRAGAPPLLKAAE